MNVCVLTSPSWEPLRGRLRPMTGESDGDGEGGARRLLLLLHSRLVPLHWEGQSGEVRRSGGEEGRRVEEGETHG